MGGSESLSEESHKDGLIEYPHYTRPASYKNMRVPEILLSGNHNDIKKWRDYQSLRRTLNNKKKLNSIIDKENEMIKKLVSDYSNRLNFNFENEDLFEND